MTFLKRLRYYIIGFGIGIVMSVILFGQRGCDWTPANRVLKQIATSQILISDSVKCVMAANNIKEDDIFQMLNNGDVLFSESNTQSSPKDYVIQHPDKEFKLLFVVRNDSVSVVSGVPDGKKGDCDAADANAHILKMPEETVKRVLRHNLAKNQLSAADSILTQLEKNKIGEGEVYNMIGDGSIDFEKSTPLSKPHPIYVVHYQKYVFTLEMTPERTRLLEFKKK